MRLLAWDTSTPTGAVGALEWEAGDQAPRLVAELALNVDARHSERLLWSIDQVLRAARWKLDEVDVFGVGVGPGSFTGLRIGITTARTLAHAQKKPLVGVSSLAALARPAASWLTEAKIPALVIAATDACKGELFTLYGRAEALAGCVAYPQGESLGLWTRGAVEEVTTPDKLAKALTRAWKGMRAPARWVGLGEGVTRYPEAFTALPARAHLLPPGELGWETPRGGVVARLAWEAWQAGLGHVAVEILPRYLRASDAELKLLAGLLVRQPTEAGP